MYVPQDAVALGLGAGHSGLAGSYAFSRKVATRVELAAFDPTNYPLVYLDEGRRKGFFSWDASDLSAKVADDPLQGIYVPPTGGNGSTGAWVRVVTGSITPLMFGANGNNTGNDEPAISAAMAWIRDQVDATTQSRRYYLSGGQDGEIYRITSSIDATLIRAAHNWGICNIFINACCTGKVAIDLTGSRFGAFSNIYIWGDQSAQPYSGIQLCRADISGAFPAAGTHYFENVTCDGYFSYTSLHNYASETNTYVKCNFWNRQATDGSHEAWGLIMDGDGLKTAISEYVTVANGAQAFNGNIFVGCTFEKTAAGSSCWISGYVGHEYWQCYWVANDAPNIVLFATSGNSDLLLDGHFEGDGMTSVIQFDGEAAADAEWVGLSVRDHKPHCLDEVFDIVHLNTVTVYDLNLSIRSWTADVQPTNGIFKDNSKFSLNNCYADLPNQLAIGNVFDFIAFSGKVVAQDLVPGRTFGWEMEGPEPATFIWRSNGDPTEMLVTFSRFNNAPAANDHLTYIPFKGSKNDASQATYAQIKTMIESASVGLPMGKLSVEVLRNGVATEMLSLSGTDNALKSAGGLWSSSPSAGIGYVAGAGASVVQTTSRTTPVTINTPVGRITTVGNALAAGATARFTVNNNCVFSADVINVSIRGGTTGDQTDVKVQASATGSFDIVVANRGSVAETGQILIGFAVVKGVVN